MDPEKQKEQSRNIKEKLVENIKRLENDGSSLSQDDFMDTIKNLNALLTVANPRDVQQISSELNLSSLFHLFNTSSNDKLCDDLVRVFGLFLEALSIQEVFLKYQQNILQGLESGNVSVVEMWIKKVVRPLFTNEGLLKSLRGNPNLEVIPILKAAIKLLSNKNTPISSAAHDVCVAIAKAFRDEFFSNDILIEFRVIKDGGLFDGKKEFDQFMIRYCEMCIDIACINEQMMEMMKSTNLFQGVVDFFEEQSDDPLITANIVKLLNDLSVKPYGLQFLKESTSFLEFINQKIQEIQDDDVLGSMILPSYIGFFINIARFQLTILNDYPSALNRLVLHCQSKNPELQIPAIEFIAFLCKENEPKVFLSDKMEVFLDTIIHLIKVGQNDSKGRAIASLNSIFEIQGADPENKACNLTEKWYQRLQDSDCGLSRFLKMASEPFLDIRIPSLNFIRILATTVWGQKILAQQPGFIDYLCDRSTENCKEGREAKFEIVKELVMSPFVRLTFPIECILKFRGYFKDGPVAEDPNVAFENSS